MALAQRAWRMLRSGFLAQLRRFQCDMPLTTQPGVNCKEQKGNLLRLLAVARNCSEVEALDVARSVGLRWRSCPRTSLALHRTHLGCQAPGSEATIGHVQHS